MIDKIKTFINSPHFKNLQDVRVVGLLIFGVIVLLVTWSGVGAIESNYRLQQQINNLKQQNSLESLQNANLNLQNQFYNTNEYLELQARQLLGKSLPGEKLILVPKTAALANNTYIASEKTFNHTPPPAKPKYQSNFESWMNFLFHRNN